MSETPEPSLPQSILWRRLDAPGHESARLFLHDSRWHLTGTAVFAHEHEACRLDYRVLCDSRWHTRSAHVAGWIGDRSVEIQLSRDSGGRWRLNETESPDVADCIDVDLNFSPSTNVLPIRRLRLAVGEEARVDAAWLRFPSFTLVRLEQVYRRIDDATYHYASAGGRFVAELTVNAAGLVTHYPKYWKAEAGA